MISSELLDWVRRTWSRHFFLTLTLVPFWVDDQALNRGGGSSSDSAMAAVVFKSKLACAFVNQQTFQSSHCIVLSRLIDPPIA
jgi:hypothetical protein